MLSILHSDSTRYVTRSVANHLNDITKENPELVVTTLRMWKTEKRQSPKELEWITRHALRTSIKKGHAGALQLLGFQPNPKLRLGELIIKKRVVNAGESLQFSLEIEALRDESLVVDYAIEFLKSGGKRSSKVYKAATVQVEKGKTIAINKSHKLLAKATTYKLYPGEHRLTIQINGRSMMSQTFEVRCP